MADAGNGFSLKTGDGREQCSGRCKENPIPRFLSKLREKISVENGGAAAAAGSAGMHILLLQIIEEQTAVLIGVTQVDSVPREQLFRNGVSQFSEISGEDQIIVPGRGPGVLEIGGDGFISGRGACQGCTIKKISRGHNGLIIQVDELKDLLVGIFEFELDGDLPAFVDIDFIYQFHKQRAGQSFDPAVLGEMREEGIVIREAVAEFILRLLETGEATLQSGDLFV